MIIAIPIATKLWERGGKKALMALYAITACVGVLGVVLHGGKHLLERLVIVASVWGTSLQSGAVIHAHYPPVPAPAALIGLGSIGLLFCLGDK